MKVAVALSFMAAVVQAKVSVSVRRELEAKPVVDAIAYFYGVNVNTLAFTEGENRKQTLFNALNNDVVTIESTLKSVLDNVERKVVHTSWLIGASFLTGLTKEDIEKLSKNPNVRKITGRFTTTLDEPLTDAASTTLSANEDTPQWGVDTVGAPSIWKYFTGKGVVVGSIDTGAAYSHIALKDNWRSNKGWFNPYNGTAHPLPIDSAQHGTHTIGTIVGKYGIGVAPDAQWISCMGLYVNSGDDVSLAKCAEFMVCPTRLDGTHPECKLGADVINNSWGGQGDYDDFYEASITAWRAVGITPIFSNGNSGPVCKSTGFPGGYQRVISVGAIGSYTDERNKLAFFSSKGPVVSKAANGTLTTIIKPDISAPGFFTLSANAKNLTGYVRMAGTSMSGPHVAGVVALLKSAQSDLTYDEIYAYITKTADRDILEPEPAQWTRPDGSVIAPGSPNCGGVSDKAWPNNRFGYGRINVGTILRDGKLNDTPTKQPTTILPTTTVATPTTTTSPATTPCPTHVTPKPTGTTPCPTNVTPKPTGTPATTPCPTNVTPKPTGTTPCPTNVTPKPTGTTPCPTNITPKPTGTTPCPTNITPKPTGTTPCPTNITPKPTGTTPCPTNITPKPTGTTPCPTNITPKPTGTTPCPTNITPKPTGTTPCPTNITPKPTGTTPCPTNITPKPTGTTPCPTNITPKPTGTTPCPTNITPKPTGTTPCPTNITPKPTGTTPCPTNITPKPTGTTPCPTNITPKPTGTTPCPTNITPKPTGTTPCPTNITPKPTTAVTPTTTKATPTPTTTKPSVCDKPVDGVDYYGNDIKSTQRSNSDDCCDDCAKTPGCVVYVWTPWNDGTCFLKWKAGKSAPYWGAKAAKVTKSVGSCQAAQANVDYYGNDIARISADKDDCCALCLTADNCKGYSHYQGHCYLKGELGYASAKAGVTSGVRN